MHPTLMPYLRIETYGAMLVLAWVVGWWVARRRACRLGVPTWHIDWLVPLLLVGSAVGAGLAGQFSRMLSGDRGNDRVLFGALLVAVGVGSVYGRVVRIQLGRLADAFAFSLPLGISLLRVGCFFAGCCWGDICGCSEVIASVDDQAWRRQVQTIPELSGEDWPVCVSFPMESPAYYQHLTAGLLSPTADRSLPVHPVQLYEAAASLVLLGILLLIDSRLRRWGDSFLLFVLAYSAMRFVIEWFRADSSVLACGLTFSQLTGLLAAIGALTVWTLRVVLSKRQPDAYARP
jgi:phosphatidylglycerol---prolipoprotein diacylglyceryl transferase